MNPKEVKLTATEELMVIVFTIYYAVPWRYLIIPLILAGLGVYAVYTYPPNAGIPTTDFVFLCIAVGLGGGLFGGAVINIFLFFIIPFFFNEIKEAFSNHFGPVYKEHRTKAQKQALNKVDDHLLK